MKATAMNQTRLVIVGATGRAVLDVRLSPNRMGVPLTQGFLRFFYILVFLADPVGTFHPPARTQLPIGAALLAKAAVPSGYPFVARGEPPTERSPDGNRAVMVSERPFDSELNTDIPVDQCTWAEPWKNTFSAYSRLIFNLPPADE